MFHQFLRMGKKQRSFSDALCIQNTDSGLTGTGRTLNKCDRFAFFSHLRKTGKRFFLMLPQLENGTLLRGCITIKI